jgi:hypothetical protein
MANTKSRRRAGRARKTQAPASKAPGMVPNMEKLTRDICAATDPFCDAAHGAASPFGTKLVTIPVSLRGFDTITSNVNGDAILLFRCTTSTIGYTAVVNNNFTTAVLVSSVGTFPSFVSQARIVTAGVRWWNIIPATAGGGTIGVVAISEMADLMDGVQHTSAQLNATSGVVISDLRTPGAFIFQSRDEIKSREFSNISTSTGILDSGFNGLALTIAGPVSQKILAYEWSFNYEVVLDPSQGVAVGTPTPAVPLVVAAINQFGLSSYITGDRDRIIKTMEARAFRAGAAVLRQGASMALNYMLPGSGAVVGAIANRRQLRLGN